MTKVAMETVDAVRRRLEVEVSGAEVVAEMDRAYDQLRRKANVRGFRHGRAPRSVLERLFGDQVRADVFGDLVRRSFLDGLKQHNIDPVGEPEIVTESAEPGEPLRYSATVEVKPSVVVEGYSGLEVERRVKIVSESDVDQFLESLRQSRGRLIPVTERTRAAAGDLATVDYHARIDGRQVGHGHDRLIEVGGEDPQSLGAHLLGLEVGEDTPTEIEYPADYANPDLAGKLVSFRLRVKALATKDLPALDDEFARQQAGAATVADLRFRVREQIEASAVRDADSTVRSDLLGALLQANDFAVPEAMVTRRTEALEQEVLDNLGARRPPASREAEFRSGLRKDLSARARDQVRAGIILDAIASQEHVRIEDAELDGRITRLVEQSGPEGEQVRAFYAESTAREALRSRLLQERALDLILERAKIRAANPESGVAGEVGNR